MSENRRSERAWHINGQTFEDKDGHGTTGATPATDRIMQELEFCNCGIPEEFQKWLLERMRFVQRRFEESSKEDWDKWYKDWREEQTRLFGDEAAYYFFQYWLDKEVFTCHGGNVGNAWMEPAGDLFVEKLKIAEKEWDEPTQSNPAP